MVPVPTPELLSPLVSDWEGAAVDEEDVVVVLESVGGTVTNEVESWFEVLVGLRLVAALLVDIGKLGPDILGIPVDGLDGPVDGPVGETDGGTDGPVGVGVGCTGGGVGVGVGVPVPVPVPESVGTGSGMLTARPPCCFKLAALALSEQKSKNTSGLYFIEGL